MINQLQDGQRVPVWLGVLRDVQAHQGPRQPVQDESQWRKSPCRPDSGQEHNLTSGVVITEYPHVGQEKLSQPFQPWKLHSLNGNILENEKKQNRLFGIADSPVV